MFFLDLLILVTHLRFSARIDRTLAERALTILKGPVNSSGKLTPEMVEEDERRRAWRRHEAYREMADRQISEALAAIMTVTEHSQS